MKEMKVKLYSVEDVKDFVNIMGSIEGAVLLYGGRYIVDAKSIMGIFSLDISSPLKLEIEEWKEEYMPLLEKYVVE